LVEKRSAAVRQNFVLVLLVVPVLEKAVWSYRLELPLVIAERLEGR
jgi:hypothetical protein